MTVVVLTDVEVCVTFGVLIDVEVFVTVGVLFAFESGGGRLPY